MNLIPPRVLLVEDDDGDALLVEEMLGEVAPHVEIVRARSVRQATEPEIEGAYACVLLDLGLPDAQGTDTLERVRRRAQHVPVIVLTGHSDERAGIDSLGAGAQEYLVKGSVDGTHLIRAIRYAVERAQAEEQRRELLEAKLEARENARLERGLLPVPLLRDPAAALVTTYRPGRRRALLGGDFYDAVELSDGSLVVTIGDVSGHGPDEAALGACLRIAWRALMLAEEPIGDALLVLDRVLVHERYEADIFATAAFVHVRADRTAADIYTAGHPPVILLSAGTPRPAEIDHVHVPLGLPAVAPWIPTTVALDGADGVLLYTDGLIEGHVGRGQERLGVEGLVAELDRLDVRVGDRAANQAFLDELVRTVETLNGGELVDDVAVALLTWA